MRIKVYVINGMQELELAAQTGKIEDLGWIIKGIIESRKDVRVLGIYLEVVKDDVGSSSTR
jgi:hypothetical protein